ncbi:MAG: exosome complex RNA-binding protein Rrp4 [Candidatus Nezhaarchaeota archaeon]|nr:exosome complex RNA-binding protein Rrp4 [Candidatus Nezhaarchaeota archaeon]
MVPGELLAEGDYGVGSYTYRENGRIYSITIGIVEYKKGVIRVVPLQGPYIPKVGDVVIGIVTDFLPTAYVLDINSHYKAVLQASEFVPPRKSVLTEDLAKYLDIGETMVCKVAKFDKYSDALLTCRDKDLGRLIDGRLIKINPAKIPRLIGRKGSMVNLIKKETGCKIIVGQNGYIWIKGKEPKLEDLAEKAIRKVEQEAHTSGLTQQIQSMLQVEKGG